MYDTEVGLTIAALCAVALVLDALLLVQLVRLWLQKALERWQVNSLKRLKQLAQAHRVQWVKLVSWLVIWL